jgi:hypothetical protein
MSERILSEEINGAIMVNHIPGFRPKAQILEEWREMASSLETINAALLAACEEMLAYHRWAKGAGNWRDEPKDPEELAVEAIRLAKTPAVPVGKSS